LNKSSYITSSSGYTAKIDYSGKGWLSGKKNSFTASLYPEGKEKEPIYTVDGQWTASFTVKEAKSKTVVDSYDPAKHPLTKLNVPTIEGQDEMESRRAWQKVAHAIAKGDLDVSILAHPYSFATADLSTRPCRRKSPKSKMNSVLSAPRRRRKAVNGSDSSSPGPNPIPSSTLSAIRSARFSRWIRRTGSGGSMARKRRMQSRRSRSIRQGS
jgi:hypothetical protein